MLNHSVNNFINAFLSCNCNFLLTVEHMPISCIDFDIVRQNFYTASNLKDLFNNIHRKCTVFFIHGIGLTGER